MPPTTIRTDNELCRDCQACTLACSVFHEGQCHLGLARLWVRKDMARYTFAVSICQQCGDPACLAACASPAMTLDRQGVVLIKDLLWRRRRGEWNTAY